MADQSQTQNKPAMKPHDDSMTVEMLMVHVAIRKPDPGEVRYNDQFWYPFGVLTKRVGIRRKATAEALERLVSLGYVERIRTRDSMNLYRAIRRSNDRPV